MEFKLDIGGSLPGERLLEKVFEWDIKNREGMSQENKDRWDKLRIAMACGWHNAWVGLGWPGEKV